MGQTPSKKSKKGGKDKDKEREKDTDVAADTSPEDSGTPPSGDEGESPQQGSLSRATGMGAPFTEQSEALPDGPAAQPGGIPVDANVSSATVVGSGSQPPGPMPSCVLVPLL